MKAYKEHNEAGHLNIFTRDHDSVVTNYGKHDRVVAFQPSFDNEYDCVTLYCRVDTKWKLGEPTEKEVLEVARKHQDVKGRYELLLKTEAYTHNGSSYSTDYVFKKLK